MDFAAVVQAYRDMSEGQRRAFDRQTDQAARQRHGPETNQQRVNRRNAALAVLIAAQGEPQDLAGWQRLCDQLAAQDLDLVLPRRRRAGEVLGEQSRMLPVTARTLRDGWRRPPGPGR